MVGKCFHDDIYSTSECLQPSNDRGSQKPAFSGERQGVGAPLVGSLWVPLEPVSPRADAGGGRVVTQV